MKRRTHLSLEPLEGRALLSGLTFDVTTNQSAYQPGQPVVMTFHEANVSNHAIPVEEGPSIDGFNVTQGGKLIWRSNAGANPLFIVSDTLQPGQSLTLSATWSGVPTGGTSPVSGTFVITNQLNPEASTMVTINSGTPVPPADPPEQPGGPQPIGIVIGPDPIPLPVSPPPTGGAPPTSPDPAPQPVLDPPAPVPVSSSIVVSVSTDHATYPNGHKVRMTMTLENVGDRSVDLPKNVAGEFALFEASTPVWNRTRLGSKDRPNRLDPGRTVKLAVSWNGKVHHSGAALAAGTYTLEAHAGGYSGSTTFQVTA